MSVRRWGPNTYAAYVDDGGPFGRFVGTASSIEDAERLVVEHEHSDASSMGEHAFVGELGAPGGSALTLRPPDDLNHAPDATGSEAPA